MNPIGKFILENCDVMLRLDLRTHMAEIRKHYQVSAFAVEQYAAKLGVSVIGRTSTVMGMAPVRVPINYST